MAPCFFYKDDIFPLKKIEFRGHHLWAPKNHTAYLAQIYGDDWNEPPSASKKLKHGDALKYCLKG